MKSNAIQTGQNGSQTNTRPAGSEQPSSTPKRKFIIQFKFPVKKNPVKEKTPVTTPTVNEQPAPTPIPTPILTPTPAPTPAPTPMPTPMPIPAGTPAEAPIETPTRPPTAILSSTETPTSSPVIISPPAETPAETPTETAPLILSPVETPTPAPSATVLQNPMSPANLLGNNNLVYATFFFSVAVVLMTIFVLVSSVMAKRLFNKRKYGKNAANLGSLKKVIAIKEELAGKWMRKRKNQNLHAIGVGKTDGTDNYCIQLFVENANGQMPENPPIHLLPEKCRKFPIYIYEMPRAEFLSGGKNYESKAKEPHETIVGGISGANTNLANEYGTIGYFCAPTILRPIRKFRKEIYLLSNCHVFADLSKTQKDNNDLIQQPSPGENKKHNFIASLEKYVPIQFDNDTENPNYIDAAIAKLFQGKEHRLEIPVIGKINDSVAKEKVEIRQKCCKFGRTTDYTEGEIFSIHMSIWIKYAATNQESFFTEQFLIVPTGSHNDFVQGGDSGSLVADNENKAIGLIFAGKGSNTHFDIRNFPDAPGIENLLTANTKKINSFGVANPINEVLKALNIKLML
ncbi:MAG: hypothetical protein WA584_07710 [Pyrinomonadaceae bacterium]